MYERHLCGVERQPERKTGMSNETGRIQEKLLVMRAQAREAGAFPQLVACYERRLLYYIHRLLGNEVDREDVLQEVWIRVFLKISTLRAPQAFRVWLYKIAHDVAMSHLRQRKRHETTSWNEDVADDLADESDWNELELLDRVELVHESLGQLSLSHREVLTLRFLEELELSDIAQVVGCAVGTVKSRLHYAKVALRKRMEEACHE
jgi:RNA polymerase sigma-70 factor (ECF subfamily)